ncbi:MAG: hypothetical protein LUC36_06545 [Oscillospiraceae bacterium]|nr:hypothetical protein [Oscillospiraceae bacterium]
MPDVKLSHAYLISSPVPERGLEKALALSAAMLCTSPDAEGRPCGVCRSCRRIKTAQHPDVTIVRRQTDDKGRPKREIYIEQIRALVADSPVLPIDAPAKVYIITDAGTMNYSAQNALLKLLEEPPDFLSIILVTEAAGQLLETVRSRCVEIALGGDESEPDESARQLARRWIECAAGGDRLALVALTNEMGALDVRALGDFAEAARRLAADMLCRREDSFGLPRAEIMRLERLAEKCALYLRFNVSPKHLGGMLSAETISFR